jgi:hypothetical protein
MNFSDLHRYPLLTKLERNARLGAVAVLVCYFG